MKRLEQTYVLQDSITKQPKMFKAMTVEESQDANALLERYESTCRWVHRVRPVIVPEEISREQAA